MASTLRPWWGDGQPALGVWCSLPDSVAAEFLAMIGYDYLCIDAQHGMVDFSAAVPILQAVHGTGCVPLVRLPDHDPALIGHYLDAGVSGIIAPMVETAEQAGAVVAATRFPPRGTRSYGPLRAGAIIGSRATEDVEQVLVLVMVETLSGLEQVEEIAAVDGIDGIYVGPADLACALGIPPGNDPDDDRHREAVLRVLGACKANGLIAGVHCIDPELARRRLDEGFTMVTVSQDADLLRRGAAAQLRAAQGQS